jgi:uncharacterized protein (TIGR00730 family)
MKKDKRDQKDPSEGRTKGTKSVKTADERLPRLLSPAAWEKVWERHWTSRGETDYELPEEARADHEFLTQVRTPAKESERLKRINRELEHAFTRLYRTGPAVTVFGSARFKPNHRYYRLAREVGAELARAGFATLTGGGPGIMEAANRGAHEAGGASLGLNIILPHEQSANPYVDENIEFSYFFTRKVCLVKYSCAFIVMPGGLGTLDEMFEALTLVQCRKIGPFPIVMVGTEFWHGLRAWSQDMIKAGVFARDEVKFAHLTDCPKEAVDLIVRAMPAEVKDARFKSRAVARVAKSE